MMFHIMLCDNFNIICALAAMLRIDTNKKTINVNWTKSWSKT